MKNQTTTIREMEANLKIAAENYVAAINHGDEVYLHHTAKLYTTGLEKAGIEIEVITRNTNGNPVSRKHSIEAIITGGKYSPSASSDTVITYHLAIA